MKAKDFLEQEADAQKPRLIFHKIQSTINTAMIAGA